MESSADFMTWDSGHCGRSARAAVYRVPLDGEAHRDSCTLASLHGSLACARPPCLFARELNCLKPGRAAPGLMTWHPSDLTSSMLRPASQDPRRMIAPMLPLFMKSGGRAPALTRMLRLQKS